MSLFDIFQYPFLVLINIVLVCIFYKSRTNGLKRIFMIYFTGEALTRFMSGIDFYISYEHKTPVTDSPLLHIVRLVPLTIVSILLITYLYKHYLEKK